MTVRLDGPCLRLEGACPVEDAEALVAALQTGGIEAVDLAECRGLHTAVAQALLAFGVPLFGVSADPFVRDQIAPALEAARGGGQAGRPSIQVSTNGAPDGPSHQRS